MTLNTRPVEWPGLAGDEVSDHMAAGRDQTFQRGNNSAAFNTVYLTQGRVRERRLSQRFTG